MALTTVRFRVSANVVKCRIVRWTAANLGLALLLVHPHVIDEHL
jgi:hypothetical protein